jgi:hypothetical protein
MLFLFLFIISNSIYTNCITQMGYLTLYIIIFFFKKNNFFIKPNFSYLFYVYILKTKLFFFFLKKQLKFENFQNIF